MPHHRIPDLIKKTLKDSGPDHRLNELPAIVGTGVGPNRSTQDMPDKTKYIKVCKGSQEDLRPQRHTVVLTGIVGKSLGPHHRFPHLPQNTPKNSTVSDKQLNHQPQMRSSESPEPSRSMSRTTRKDLQLSRNSPYQQPKSWCATEPLTDKNLYLAPCTPIQSSCQKTLQRTLTKKQPLATHLVTIVNAC
ncbi:hypothetical protein UPYG_G00141080 [Umbra pygmaea]|uniref:Uncharacterized protein n=1 Tax=Umbra pygmaea TaxID=75934 RepID=A0ABD0XDP7_UMBPY